jgi:hypothetical protein
MTRHQGGDRVNAGFYLNVESWEVATVSGSGGVLSGSAGARYLRVPTLLLLVFAPLMGAVYAIFLPFIGIAMVVHFLARRAGIAVRDGAHAVLAATSPAWRPGEASFTGSADAGTTERPAAGPGHGEADQVDARLATLEREIERRDSTSDRQR